MLRSHVQQLGLVWKVMIPDVLANTIIINFDMLKKVEVCVSLTSL